jgi:cytoskeletal protein CcmA (bactofilin family)
VVGGQINITGTIGGNITAAGGSITISDDAEISGSIVAAGGSVTVQARVGKTITAGAGQLTIANVVNGNVLAGVGELSLTPNSEILGNLTYYSEENAELQTGATISGTVQHFQPPVTEKKANEAAQTAKRILKGLSVMWQFVRLVSAFIVGSLLILFVPTFMKRTGETIGKRPGFSFGIGILAVVITPILVLFLLSTIIGIPLGMMLLFVYIAYMYLAKIPVVMFIGEKFLGYANYKRSSQILSLLIGLIIYGILHFIPVIGSLIGLIVLFLGIGALLITKRDFYQMLRTKNTL